ncbi:MAG: hypothetical protein AAFY34_06590 [Pseudomonadota bacterium]
MFASPTKTLLGLLGLAINVSLLVACGGQTPEGDSEPRTTPPLATIIAPRDFALAPCDGAPSEALCVILAAGGKRVLIGAPAGVGDGRLPGEDVFPDAVLLPSLHPRNIEGLDELRYQTWAGGRTAPLSVTGPAGTADFIDGLNTAYTLPDAVAFLDTSADNRDFAAMPLRATDVRSGDTAFDTGDLVLTANAAGRGHMAFRATYGGQSILIIPCGANIRDLGPALDNATIVTCTQDADSLNADMTWPLQTPVFLNRPDPE